RHTRPAPGLLGRRPRPVGVHGLVQGAVGDLQDQVVVAALGHLQVEDETHRTVVTPGPDRVAGPAPAHTQPTAASRPAPVPLAHVTQWFVPELGHGLQPYADLGRAVDRFDTPQQDQPVGVAGESEGFTALDDALDGDPPAAPDQRPLLVM